LSELAPALGVAAALIGLADMAPHVRDTVRPCTRPHRGTWLIWTVLAVVVSLSQHLLIAGRRAAMRARDGLGWIPDSRGCAVGDSGAS
jgi:hypothetical protein